jgi:hypothetical protein
MGIDKGREKTLEEKGKIEGGKGKGKTGNLVFLYLGKKTLPDM